jgi:hypothetical protein
VKEMTCKPGHKAKTKCAAKKKTATKKTAKKKK